MQAFIEKLNLNFEKFCSIIEKTSAIVAGSLPLALYLDQIGQKSFEPKDMDIFVHKSQNCDKLVSFFTDSQYSSIFSSDGTAYHTALNDVRGLTTINLLESEFTVDIIKVGFDETIGIKNHIIKSFDLSSCMTWWNGTLETAFPELTDKMQMVSMNSQFKLARVEKYIKRGFTHLLVCENKCCKQCKYRDAYNEIVDRFKTPPRLTDVILRLENGTCQFRQRAIRLLDALNITDEIYLDRLDDSRLLSKKFLLCKCQRHHKLVYECNYRLFCKRYRHLLEQVPLEIFSKDDKLINSDECEYTQFAKFLMNTYGKFHEIEHEKYKKIKHVKMEMTEEFCNIEDNEF